MPLQDIYISFLRRLPGIAEPLIRLSFKSKLSWTAVILLMYFLMGQISVWGIIPTSFEQFKILEILLGSSFGSLMTLGIGPIVTASIILQLLVGSKIIPWDLRTENGRIMFHGTQKLLAIIFSFVEAGAFVFMGAIPAAPGLAIWVLLQIAAGGILVIFMDELISKWGFGSGVGLFIVAGVSKGIFVRAFNPLTTAGTLPGLEPPAGAIPFSIIAIAGGELVQALLALMPVIATIIVFFIVIYTNAIRVEIPLAFGSIRGFGRRWPLRFFYTSNIPVILVAALLANIQLMARIANNPWFGTFDSAGHVTGGLVYFLIPPSSQALSGFLIFAGLFALIGVAINYWLKKGGLKVIIAMAVIGSLLWFGAATFSGLTSLTVVSAIDIVRIGTYTAFMVCGAILFSVFWVATSGMDPRSVAQQIESIGLQIPGYRRDSRIIESVLNRYIPGLAVLGGATVGLLAAFADFTGALGTGTGLLLSTLIIYNLYEDIAAKHLEDMNPAIRKFFGEK
jgi:preprotein translocase subunit SecY